MRRASPLSPLVVCRGGGAWREAKEAGGEGERGYWRRLWLCRPRKSGGGLGFR
jgi:hypothetical protein